MIPDLMVFFLMASIRCWLDATDVEYRNLNKYTDAEVYAPAQTKAVNYLLQPLHVYGIGLDRIIVSGDEEVTRVIAPAAFARKVNIRIIVTGQRSAIASCSAKLDGIASGVNIATGSVDQSGMGSILLEPAATADGFESVVRLFGRVVSGANALNVVFNYRSGESQTLNVDISSALKDINTEVVEVAIKVNFEVTTTSGGFKATLNDWSSETRQVTAE